MAMDNSADDDEFSNEIQTLTMDDVFHFLTDEKKYKPDRDENYKRSLRRKAKNFCVRDGMLCT
jgi:hypothetical protein